MLFSCPILLILRSNKKCIIQSIGGKNDQIHTQCISRFENKTHQFFSSLQTQSFMTHNVSAPYQNILLMLA